MFDFDLAALYEVETKALNQAVKRNSKRFPPDCMFRLTITEWQIVRSQSVTEFENGISLRSQSVTLKTSRGQHAKYLPYAFTEQGVAREGNIEQGISNVDWFFTSSFDIPCSIFDIQRGLLSLT